jgi:hypothetical protein
MLDGSSKRARMPTTPLFTSPTNFPKPGQSTFQHARRLRRRVSPIVINKKTCCSSMICITILRSFFSSILQVSEHKNASNRGGRMPHEAETVPSYDIGASFRADRPRRSICWLRLPAAAYDFMIRRHTIV